VQDGALKWPWWKSSTLTIGLITQAIAYDVDATNNLLPPNYLHGFTFPTSKRLSNFFAIVARSFNARLDGYRIIVEHHLSTLSNR